MHSMYRIKGIARGMLEEKMADAVSLSDMDAKRDIMSLLVRARATQKEGAMGDWMDDDGMVEQVVS
jgi:hypothetical protein